MFFFNSIPPFNCTKQGFSHIKANKVCQDFSGCYRDKLFSTIAVSDGHGSERYFRSDIGSRLAVEITIQCVKEFVSEFYTRKGIEEEMVRLFRDNPDQYMRQLESSIVARWRNKVNEHYSNNPFTNKESSINDGNSHDIVKAYGATLISVTVVKGYFWFGIQIGDGRCITINDNKADQPIPKNKKCFLRITTSLCDEEPLKEFRHYVDDHIPEWIFIGSDGIEDSFKDDIELHNFYLEIIRLFKKRRLNKALREINAYLPILSQKGSGDDMSIAGINNK